MIFTHWLLNYTCCLAIADYKLDFLFADVDLKATAKLFAGRFACGSSVTAADEIVVQGDVKDEILEIIGTKWPFIDSNLIEDLGDQKR